MAKKKRKKRSMSQSFPLAKRGKGGKVGKRKKRKGFLSEVGLIGIGGDSGKVVMGGFGGGFAAGLLNDMIPDGWTFLGRSAANLGLSLLAHRMKMPNTSAGISGAYGMLAYQKLKTGSLQEDHEYVDEDLLNEYPMFCDADGNALGLSEDGNLYYLNEAGEMVEPADELSEVFPLSENMYPSYVNPDM